MRKEKEDYEHTLAHGCKDDHNRIEKDQKIKN